MKGGTLQILWHGSDPVLSVDFHLSTGLLATAGADRDIKLWAIHRGENARATPSAAYKANLSHHNAAVNMLRFSPSGELLASGADNGELLIWKISQTENGVPAWKVYKILRGHTKDVLGLDWSSDDAFLVSCSVDNTCLIWNVVKGIVEQMVSDHQHYVQGVTWDPTDKYLASISGDRSCRIYSAEVPVRKSKAKEKNAKRMYHCQHVLCKTGATTPSAIPAAAVTAATTVEGHEAPHKQVSTSKQYLFHDENMQSFFRRLSWSPDGSFLLIPAGIEKHSPEASPSNVSYIVSRNNLSRPLLALPAASKPVVATRFCPVLFSLNSKKARDNDESGVAVFDLPYRIIFAVATVNSVYIYDTEKSCPIAILGGLHFATITDIAWSYDAKYLAISSQDGYCTLVGFDEGDLGTPARLADLPPNVASLLPANRVALLHSSGSIHCDGSHKDALPRDCTELAQKRVTPEKTPPKEDSSVGRVDVQVAGKTFENHSRYISKSRALRRIGPTPLPENLLPSASVDIKFDANRPTLDSGGSGDFDSKGCHPPGELDFRECKLNMEEVSAGASHLSAGKADLDRIGQNKIVLPVAPSKSDCVDVSAGLESPNCKVKDEEAAASPQAVAEFSKNQPHVADTAQGPSTPLCRDHGSGLDVSPVTVVKPVDPYTDIYVRPLKFRRVSPCMVSHVEKEGALKSVGKEM